MFCGNLLLFVCLEIEEYISYLFAYNDHYVQHTSKDFANVFDVCFF